MKTEIVAINAKNVHKALAPWRLKAYCEGMGVGGIGVIEATVNDNVIETVAKIYKAAPSVVGLSCCIWNIDYVNKVGGLLKKLLPEVKVVLGGPEVSFEEDLSGFPFADYIIRGAGETAFFELLKDIENNVEPQRKIIDGGCENFDSFPSPYTEDYFKSFEGNQIPHIENQLIYFESSRGCPFSCSYCLSSVAKDLQYLSLERTKNELRLLTEKGAKCVKFVDRTFNADKKRAKEILQFVYSLQTDCTFHFEAAADLFDEEMLQIIEKMPPCRVQFEIGLQSVNENVLSATGRKTDTAKVLANISRLTSFQNCHIHVDLIAGLPLETPETFAEAVNKCIGCRPHMLQLGFLKMLKGARIRKENAFGEVFAPFAPYEVVKTGTMTFADIVKLKAIENVIEKFYNSGAFAFTLEYAFKLFTPYDFFEKFADYCRGANFKVSMKTAYTVLTEFLLSYGDKREIEHGVKLDCFTVDYRSLPNGIKTRRNKQAEALYRAQTGRSGNFRIEFFEFENAHKLLDFDSKNAVTHRFEVRDISVADL